MQIVIIAAIASNGVIGDEGDIPWYYPADLENFKQVTMGNPVIMGRRTYENIIARLDRPLPGRRNIVLSKDGIDTDYEDVIVARNLDEAIQAAEETGSETSYIIGGESVYRQALEKDIVDRLAITHIPETPEGDTYWPGPNLESFDKLDSTYIDEDLEVATYNT